MTDDIKQLNEAYDEVRQTKFSNPFVERESQQQLLREIQIYTNETDIIDRDLLKYGYDLIRQNGGILIDIPDELNFFGDEDGCSILFIAKLDGSLSLKKTPIHLKDHEGDISVEISHPPTPGNAGYLKKSL